MPRTGPARVTHGSCTGSFYAPHGPVGMVVRVFITSHAVRTGPYAPHDAPTCALQIQKTVLIGFAITWSKYRRHTPQTRRNPVDHVTTNIAEHLRVSYGRREKKKRSPKKLHVTGPVGFWKLLLDCFDTSERGASSESDSSTPESPYGLPYNACKANYGLRTGPAQSSACFLRTKCRRKPVSKSCACTTFGHGLYGVYTGPKICEKSCGFARHAVRSRGVPQGFPEFWLVRGP